MKKFFNINIAVMCFSIAHAQQITLHNPEIIPMTLESVSLPLSQLPESPVNEDLNGYRPEKDNPSLENHMQYINPNALPKGADPALQTNYSNSTLRGTAATVLSNWVGLTAAVDPSDNTIAVGPNHVMQMTNNSSSTYIRIWNKSGTVLINKKKVSTITAINDYGDPNVIYDQQADRYVMCVLYSFSAKKLVVCITQTNDPTGSWYVYTIKTAGGFPDYPKIAVWGNSYFITTNSNSPSVFALNRSQMLTGAAVGSAQKFSMSSFPSIGFQSASPVDETGATAPPNTEPEIIIRVADDGWGGSITNDHLELFKVVIDWVNPSNSTFTGPTKLNTLSYNSNLCGYGNGTCIPQKGSNKKLDPLSDIIMDKVQYRSFSDHESMVCSHVCNADGSGTAGIRWYELRTDVSGNWYIYQQSTYQPDNTHRFMSSVTLNGNGAIALGYNASSSSVYPAQRFTGRASVDSLNTMTIPENTPQAGSAANGSNRYGDYNGMLTDPGDNSFWFTANYNPSSSWATNVCHFTIAYNEPKAAPFNIVINNITMHTVELSWTGQQTPVYEVRYREAGNTDWISAGTTSLADYAVAGLNPDTRYEFSLGGKAGSDVLYSESISATTLKEDGQPAESTTTTQEISIAPVPASDNVQITFTAQAPSNAQIQIYSLNGQLALTQSFLALDGVNITNTNAHSLKNGTYILRLTTDQGVSVKKIMIQR